MKLDNVYVTIEPESLARFKSELAREVAFKSGHDHIFPALEAAMLGDKTVELPKIDFDPIELLKRDPARLNELFKILKPRIVFHEAISHEVEDVDIPAESTASGE